MGDVARQCAVVAAVAGGILSGATGDYGDAARSPSPLLPADYAFGIWGPIYLGALAYAAHQARPSRRADPLLRRTGWPAAAAVGLSGTWVRLQDPPVLQLPVIAATMTAAGVALVRAQPLPTDGDAPVDRWAVRAPLGLLAGWLTLATTAATTEVLIASRVPAPRVGVDRAGAAVLAATGGAALATARRLPRTTGYAAAVTWGLVGVAVRGARRWPTTASVAAAGAVALACTVRSRGGPGAPSSTPTSRARRTPGPLVGSGRDTTDGGPR